MRALKTLIFALIALCGLSGCLTIEEHYVFRRNGSGEMKFVIDLGEVRQSLQTALRSDASRLIAGELQFDSIANRLAYIPGIKRVEVIQDLYQYRFGISFRFKNVVALNAALNVIIEGEHGHPLQDYIRFSEGEIRRLPVLPEKHFNLDAQNDPEGTARMRALLQKVGYQLRITTARKIRAYESKLTRFKAGSQKNHKSVWFQADLLSLTDNPSLLETSVYTR